MNFNEWLNLTDNEKDKFSLDDAYKAGAMAMFDHLTDLMDELDEAGYKNLKEEARVLLDGEE